jgi:hypothetical protein
VEVRFLCLPWWYIGRGGDISQFICFLPEQWMEVRSQLRTQHTLLLHKQPNYPLNWRLGGPWSWSGQFRELKISWLYIEPWFFCHAAHRLVTTLTELSQLHLYWIICICTLDVEYVPWMSVSYSVDTVVEHWIGTASDHEGLKILDF